MRIVITGGAGFLGSALTRRLLEAEEAAPGASELEITCLDLTESPVEDPRVHSIVGAIDDPEIVAQAITERTDAVAHLAAVLSGGSEEDHDLAMRVNLEGTRVLLEAARTATAARAEGTDLGDAPVRFLFTSSLAVFGGELPETVPATWGLRPDSGYGALKAIGELLVNEYSRRGFVDGRVCRLPTISVRPGRPNSAASSFVSGMVREPLRGEPSVLPVPRETRLWIASPDTTVTNLHHALRLPAETLGAWRVLDLPGITVTAGELLEALEDSAGSEMAALVREEADARVAAIVTSWPGAVDVTEALALGFSQDTDADQIVAQHRTSTGV